MLRQERTPLRPIDHEGGAREDERAAAREKQICRRQPRLRRQRQVETSDPHPVRGEVLDPVEPVRRVCDGNEIVGVQRQRERLEQFARPGPRGHDASHLRASRVEDVDPVATAIEDDVLAVAGDGKRGVVIELRHDVRRRRGHRLQHVRRGPGKSRCRDRKRQHRAPREDFGIRYHRDMRLTAAQLNLTVGAFDANFERIRTAVARAEAESSELVVFSEMATTGYPPRDLLTHPAFVDRNLDMLERVARLSTGRLAILVGFVDRNPSSQGKPLLNAAALCRSGRVVERRYKSLLPTYDVFDEDRYFEPARDVSPMPCGDVRLGVTICEDVWNDKDVWTKPRYHRDPVCEVAAAGADVLINISASPFTLDSAGCPAAPRDAGGSQARPLLLLRQPGRRQRRAGLRRPLDWYRA